MRMRRERTRLLIERLLAEEDRPLGRVLYEQYILLEVAQAPLYLAAVLPCTYGNKCRVSLLSIFL